MFVNGSYMDIRLVPLALEPSSYSKRISCHKQKATSMRPKIITMFCVFFGVLQLLNLLASMQAIFIVQSFVDVPVTGYSARAAFIANEAKQITMVSSVFNMIANVLILVSIVGAFQLKRWSAYLLGAVVLAGTFGSQYIGLGWNLQHSLGVFVPYVLPALFCAVIMPHWSDFSDGFDLSYDHF
tara:strand:+ start:103 stop:651 length:549 start_codon:yes stop_codon:yes gene_type:complete